MASSFDVFTLIVDIAVIALLLIALVILVVRKLRQPRAKDIEEMVTHTSRQDDFWPPSF